MYIIIDILIFRVSMNGKGDKFQLGIKFLYDFDRLFVICLLVETFGDQDWVAQMSIKFKSQLNLKCKLILCTFQVNLSTVCATQSSTVGSFVRDSIGHMVHF